MPYLQELEQLGKAPDQTVGEEVGVTNHAMTLSPAKLLSMKKPAAVGTIAAGVAGKPANQSTALVLANNTPAPLMASPMLMIESGPPKPKEIPKVIYDYKSFEEEWEIKQYD